MLKLEISPVCLKFESHAASFEESLESLGLRWQRSLEAVFSTSVLYGLFGFVDDNPVCTAPYSTIRNSLNNLNISPEALRTSRPESASRVFLCPTPPWDGRVIGSR